MTTKDRAGAQRAADITGIAQFSNGNNPAGKAARALLDRGRGPAEKPTADPERVLALVQAVNALHRNAHELIAACTDGELTREQAQNVRADARALAEAAGKVLAPPGPPRWERVNSPRDRRVTLYWRLQLRDRSWVAVSPLGPRAGREWLWAWRTGPRPDQVRSHGMASLATARRHAEQAVARVKPELLR